MIFNVSLSDSYNLDLIDFSAAIIYDYDIKGIYRFYYSQMRLKLEDYVTNFTKKA